VYNKAIILLDYPAAKKSMTEAIPKYVYKWRYVEGLRGVRKGQEV